MALPVVLEFSEPDTLFLFPGWIQWLHVTLCSSLLRVRANISNRL